MRVRLPPTRRKPRVEPGDWLPFLAIAVLALTLRLVHLYQARGVVFFDHLIVDARAYDEWARRIVAGDWVGKGVFYQAPLYPYFLAVVQGLFGRDLWLIRVVQSGIGAATCGLLFLAGRTWFSRGAGIAAGLILALYPPAIFSDTLIQKTVLASLWMALLLWMLAELRERPGAARFLAVGAVLGLLVLTRENALLLAPLIALWLLIQFNEHTLSVRLRWFAGLAAGLAALLLPVAWRNYAVGGEFVLTTAQAGTNFFIGNNTAADGTYAPLRTGRSDTRYEAQDAQELASEAVGRSLSPGEASRFWFGEAFGFIRRQPGQWVKLTARKCLLLLNAYEIPDAEDQYFYARHCGLLRGLGTIGHLGVLCPLAAAGMVLTWSRRRELWLLHLLLATLAVGVVVFYVFARYRFPLVPMLVLFAAAALVETTRRIAARDYRGLAWAAVVAFPVGVVANWPIFPKDHNFAISYVNAGSALGEHGEIERAIENYREAIRLEPALAEGYGSLGTLLARNDRREQAIATFTEGLRHCPTDARLEFKLGTALAEVGNLPAAADRLQRAHGLGLASREVVSNLSTVFMQLGRLGEAVALMRAGVERYPDEWPIVTNLAWLLATCPIADLRDGATAVRLAERLCQNHGRNDPIALDTLAAAYAETGRFEDAITNARRAVQLARDRHDTGLVREIEARIQLYAAGRPFHVSQ